MDVIVVKKDPVGAQTVDLRGADVRVRVSKRNVCVPQIVDNNENNIGGGTRGEAGRWRGEEKEKEKEKEKH